MTLSGKLSRLQLAECTTGFLPRPWRGSAPELELTELTLVDGVVERVRFRGLLTGVVLGDVLAPWGLTEVGGDLELYVNSADLSPLGIERLVAFGRCHDVSLEELSQGLGWGRMTGNARVVIDDFTISQNRLTSLDAEIIVQPPDGEPNLVARDLVAKVLSRTLGVTLPPVLLARLPEHFEYAQFGARFEVRDELLHVFGTHGPREKTILSMTVGEQELPVVSEPEEPFELSGYLEGLRARMLAHLAQRWQTFTPEEAWRAISTPLHPGPTTRGASRDEPDPE